MVDDFGAPAYHCARDRAPMVLVDGQMVVLQCPTCGHRTDEPGDGVLGDGFDIVHRQFGARGDTHAWNALRDAVARTPTPPSDEAVRQALVDALRDVTTVDIDTTTEARVHLAHLDHGGMSGGVVDITWWREKGMPLLVQRATTRRPVSNPATRTPDPGADRPRRLRGAAGTVAVWVILLAIPAATVGGGAWLLYQRTVGTRVEATVLTCDSSGHFRRFGSTFRTECVAEWTIDGRTVVGNFTAGNGESDVGKTLDATVRGDTAYSRSLGLPVLLIALGSPFVVFLGLAIKRRVATQRSESGDRADTAAVTAPPA